MIVDYTGLGLVILVETAREKGLSGWGRDVGELHKFLYLRHIRKLKPTLELEDALWLRCVTEISPHPYQTITLAIFIRHDTFDVTLHGYTCPLQQQHTTKGEQEIPPIRSSSAVPVFITNIRSRLGRGF